MSSDQIKRGDFYAERPYPELAQALSWRTAARAANVWGAHQGLVALYRSWMREHALMAVRRVRTIKMA